MNDFKKQLDNSIELLNKLFSEFNKDNNILVDFNHYYSEYINLLSDFGYNKPILNSILENLSYITKILYNKDNITKEILNEVNQIIIIYTEQLKNEINRLEELSKQREENAIKKLQYTQEVINKQQKSTENIKITEKNIFNNIEVQEKLNKKLKEKEEEEPKKKQEEERKKKEEEERKKKEEEKKKKKEEKERKRREKERKRRIKEVIASSYSPSDMASDAYKLIIAIVMITIVVGLTAGIAQTLQRKTNSVQNQLERTIDLFNN